MKYKNGPHEMEGDPNEIIEIINHIDKTGFNMNYFQSDEKKHSRWHEKKKLIIGVLMIVIAGGLIFSIPKMIGMKYFFTRLLLCLGIVATADDLISGTVDLKLSFPGGVILKATGVIGLFLALYFISPPKIFEETPSTTSTTKVMPNSQNN